MAGCGKIVEEVHRWLGLLEFGLVKRKSEVRMRRERGKLCPHFSSSAGPLSIAPTVVRPLIQWGVGGILLPSGLQNRR